jgi:Rrf2 family cysteine metabolism transcriptional repressor
MKLSTRVRYGLRALIELAALQQDSPVLLDMVARKQGISRKYLDAIFARLKAAGIVTSSRGAGGGFLLAMDPSEITVYDVYIGLEGPVALVDCRSQDRHCGMVDICPTREVWEELSNRMEEYMRGLTVEMLLEKKRKQEESSSMMFYI